MRVLLIGFMGAGKTTVGELLAERLGARFFDVDEVVEAAAGIAVSEIFETRGEGEFRRLEREALADLVHRDDAVVAAGGGAVSEAGSFAQLPAGVVTIWLDPPLDLIDQRLQSVDSVTRPLYRSRNEVARLYQERLPRYEKADLRIEIDAGESAEDIVERIVEALEERQCAIS